MVNPSEYALYRAKELRKWQEKIIRENMSKLDIFSIDHIKIKWLKKFIVRRFYIHLEDGNVSIYKNNRLIAERKYL